MTHKLNRQEARGPCAAHGDKRHSEQLRPQLRHERASSAEAGQGRHARRESRPQRPMDDGRRMPASSRPFERHVPVPRGLEARTIIERRSRAYLKLSADAGRPMRNCGERALAAQWPTTPKARARAEDATRDCRHAHRGLRRHGARCDRHRRPSASRRKCWRDG